MGGKAVPTKRCLNAQLCSEAGGEVEVAVFVEFLINLFIKILAHPLTTHHPLGSLLKLANPVSSFV